MTQITRRQLLQAYSAMPAKFRDCLDIGHPWIRGNSEPLGNGDWERSFECPRCDTKRFQVLSRGYIVGNRYIYPEGYGIKGAGNYDRDRRAIVRIVSTPEMPQPKFRG